MLLIDEPSVGLAPNAAADVFEGTLEEPLNDEEVSKLYLGG